jgi:sigma-B regulation protein RsbU (phosphoserine phosphatase)
MRAPPLGRLIDVAALADLVEATTAVAPNHEIRVLDVDGSTLVPTSSASGQPPIAGAPSATRAIAVGGEPLGTVEISGPAGQSDAIAELVGRSIEMAATEALRRRSIASIALEQELAIGRRIQLSLMPRRFPDLPGWEIASAYEPAREVGGDFYDAFLIGGHGDRLGIVVADVTGKGIAAALLMADTRALIHAAADHSTDPADSLARVNRILVHERASGLFVTVAHGLIHGPTGTLMVASAGHDPVHILRADGSLTAIEPSGRLIGMVDDIRLTSRHLVIEPGDTFVGHTDGVTEARSPDGSFYGEDRFRAMLSTLAGRSAREIVDAITTDVAGFRGDAEPSDDLTLLVVRRDALGRGDAYGQRPMSRSGDPG